MTPVSSATPAPIISDSVKKAASAPSKPSKATEDTISALKDLTAALRENTQAQKAGGKATTPPAAAPAPTLTPAADKTTPSGGGINIAMPVSHTAVNTPSDDSGLTMSMKKTMVRTGLAA
jgi:hypothetical protein